MAIKALYKLKDKVVLRSPKGDSIYDGEYTIIDIVYPGKLDKCGHRLNLFVAYPHPFFYDIGLRRKDANGTVRVNFVTENMIKMKHEPATQSFDEILNGLAAQS